MGFLKSKPALSPRDGELRTREEVLADTSLKISRAHEVFSILAEDLLGQPKCLATFEGNAYVPSNIIESIYELM